MLKLLVFPVILAIYGCAYKPIPTLYQINLIPIGMEPLWENGFSTLNIKESTFSTHICYKGYKGNHYEFEFKMDNISSDTLTIASEKFYYNAIQKVKKNDFRNSQDSSLKRIFQNTETLISDSLTVLSSVNSLDPEELIKSTNNLLSRLRKEENPYSLTGLDIGLKVAGGVVSILSLFSETDAQRKERERDEEEERERERERERDERHWERTQKEKIYQAESLLDYYQTKLVRKHTLYPGKSFSGVVLFPICENAKELELVIPLKKAPLIVKYQQELLYY